MARRGKSPRQLDDPDLLARVQSILINSAEGRRSIADDRHYAPLRSEILRRGLGPLGLVETHRTVDSFSAFVRGIESRTERVEMIRREFRPLLRHTLKIGDTKAETWTGISSPREKLVIVRKLLPLAESAVEGLIQQLSESGPNGGPILDERERAIDHLRALHRALGELLAAAESGHLHDELGQGLAAEVARYAKRAAFQLRDDPMPYVASGLLLGILSACGLPGIGGYLGGIALNIKRTTNKDAG